MRAAERPPLVLVRAGGELATAAARLLFLAGYRVLVTERAAPLAVRRRVCFAEAIHAGAVEVEGVAARRVAPEELDAAWAGGWLPVLVDPEGGLITRLRPDAVVDARMAKRNLGTRLADARLVVGLGPGFEAGTDVHAVVETQRGPDLGRVLWNGSAQADTGEPAAVLGVREARVLRAARDGEFQPRASIGDVVAAGTAVGEVSGAPVLAGTGGLLRGLIAGGTPVAAGTKLGDVDPRGRQVDAARLSDKARAVAAGVLEAVAVGLRRARSAAASGPRLTEEGR